MHKSFWSALWTTFPYFMLNIVIILKMFTVKILQEYVNQTDNSHLGLGRDCKPNSFTSSAIFGSLKMATRDLALT